MFINIKRANLFAIDYRYLQAPVKNAHALSQGRAVGSMIE